MVGRIVVASDVETSPILRRKMKTSNSSLVASMLLFRWREIQVWLHVESMILARQREYYTAFMMSESRSECGPFVKYMLTAIHETLLSYCEQPTSPSQREDALLALVRANPTRTIAEIAAHLGVSLTTVDRVIASLRGDDCLRR